MKKLSFLFLLICFFLIGCSQEKRMNDILDVINLKDRINVGIKTDTSLLGILRNGEIKDFVTDIDYEITKRI